MNRTKADPPTRAVLLDAMGTLLELEPPAPRLARLLGLERDERIEHAMRLEMAYYRDHAHEGADEASLADLRARCAQIVSRELEVEISAETLLQAIVFRAFPEAAPALAALRDAGLILVCVSNWDCSLPDVLARVGLAEHLDGVVASATAGATKPDPSIFEQALELAGCSASEAIHVGDSPAEDAAGARAAGIRALLISRDASADRTPGSTPAGAPDAKRRMPRQSVVISSLIEISHHLST